MHIIRSYFRSKAKRSFTIIELLVTCAIMGLLLATILPTMNRYSRDNGVAMAAQEVREAIAEAQSYAVNPDPTVCVPRSPLSTLSYPITSYMFFVPSTTSATTPASYTTITNKYECGLSDLAVTLSNNQYAIMARAQDTTDPTIFYDLGIVRVGKLDDPAKFMVPIDGAGEKPIYFGYDPSTSNIIYPSGSSYNYMVDNGQNIRSLKFSCVVQDSMTNKFTLIGVTNDSDFRLVVFVNSASGQVSSTGIIPVGLCK